MNHNVFNYSPPQDCVTRKSWLLLMFVFAGGAALRLWGLENIGLHGDEDVMGLATRALRETGWPVLPSGMEYVRALPQLYLMAWSTQIFGESEWALRLPSVLIGSGGILVGYWLGRRFLTVNWSIVFAVVIALLPALISASQTARMYIFYVTLVMAFAVAIFRWERTGSVGAYLVSVLVCVTALSFHALTVFSALLFFYPGLVKSSFRMLGFGAIALALCVFFQQEHSAWVGSHYFDLVELGADQAGSGSPSLIKKVSVSAALLGALAIVAITTTAYVFAKQRRLASEQIVWFVASILCLASATVLAYLVQYHMAALAYIFGVILFMRSGFTILLPTLLGVVLFAMFALHAWIGWQLPYVQDVLALVERLSGLPYPKSYFTFAAFAPLAVVVYAATVLYFFVQFARGRPLPDHVLFFLIAVFAPLFIMGFLTGQYVPSRYVIGFLPFFVLAVFAGASDVLIRHSAKLGHRTNVVQPVVLALLILAFVSPKELWYNVNPRSGDFRHLADHRGVDHRGAAEFILSQNLNPEDIVISVDTQQQVYYLGERVDYYLRAVKGSRNSSFMRDGQMLCLYTGRSQISTGDELEDVLSESVDHEVFVIGNGELEAGNRQRNLGDGIWETMEKFGVREVYRGADGATRVWRYSAGDSMPTSTEIR